MKKKAFTLIELLVVLAIIAFIAIIIFANFFEISPNGKAIKILQQEGYHDIRIEGYNPTDVLFYKIKFTAVNADGNTIHGVVTGDNYNGWKITKN